jgi:hypothetical protein
MSNLMSKYKRSSPSLVNTPLQVSLLDHGASCSTGRINKLLGSFWCQLGQHPKTLPWFCPLSLMGIIPSQQIILRKFSVSVKRSPSKICDRTRPLIFRNHWQLRRKHIPVGFIVGLPIIAQQVHNSLCHYLASLIEPEKCWVRRGRPETCTIALNLFSNRY